MRCLVEPFGAWYQEAQPLFRAHWQEIARHRERFELLPDWERYLQLERAGALFAVAVREQWALVGYATFIVGRHLHYKQMRTAGQDMIYLAPAHRARGFGYCALVKFCDEELARLGVHVITQRDKAAHDLSVVYRRRGYSIAVERTHEKVL